MASEWKRPLRRTGIQAGLTQQVKSANHPERTRKVRRQFTQNSRNERGEIIATTFGEVNSARSQAQASFQVRLVESVRLNGHSICGAFTSTAALAMKLHFSKGDCGRAAAPQSERLRRIA